MTCSALFHTAPRSVEIRDKGKLHYHDYRIEAVADRERLDPRGMVCDPQATRSRMGAAAACRARGLPAWEQSARNFSGTLAGLP